jgi:hypothetical protein
MSNEEETQVSAEINYDFAIVRWAKTMQKVHLTEGHDEVVRRTAALPKAFSDRLVSYLQGEDNGAEY